MTPYIYRVMNFVQRNGLSLWQFDNLSSCKGIDHFVTDRKSNPNGDEFTLSLSSSPDKDFIRSNRRMLAAALNVGAEKLYLPSQVHKTRVVHVTSSINREELADTDALITNERGVAIAVMSADCVPILLYDQRNGAVAAVHSGWKGTVAKILTVTLERLKTEFGTRGSDVIAGIGPSVSQDSYEVGEEVVEAVESSFGRSAGLLVPQANRKAKLDLWKANEIQLRDFGVTNIEISNLCTVKQNTSFFSARKGDSGRFAAGIVLRSS